MGEKLMISSFRATQDGWPKEFRVSRPLPLDTTDKADLTINGMHLDKETKTPIRIGLRIEDADGHFRNLNGNIVSYAERYQSVSLGDLLKSPWEPTGE